MKLSKEESIIVIGLHRIVSDMDRRTKQICKSCGLTLGQFAVLEALNSKGDLTVGEVKESVLSTDGTIPVIIGNLERRGYLNRTQDTLDKRKYIVSLTARGKEMIDRVDPMNSEMLKRQLSAFDKEKRNELVKLIRTYRKQNRTEKGKKV